MGLNLLVVGAGAREHALAWMLARSEHAAHVYVAPGNAGTSWQALPHRRAAATSIAVEATDVDGLIALVRARDIDLAVIGPEAPLAAGIVDDFQAAGLRVVGPTRFAARLESSKAFAKQFMREHGIPTADFHVFDNYDAAVRFVASHDQCVVVKADGLAGGKGSIVCADKQEAQAALHLLMIERAFGEAGSTVVIEDRLVGHELSLLAFCDGIRVVPMPPARDHKPVFDGDRGPNTGGMGAIAPVADVPGAVLDAIYRTILCPVVEGMAARGTPYVGVLYAGLMVTGEGPRVLEFNCRFGDPEAQVILPLLATDLIDVLSACVEGRLGEIGIRWQRGGCATIVLVSSGYPRAFTTGVPISGLDDLSGLDDVVVFHGATAVQDGGVVTTGGRVLAVTALSGDTPAAIDRAYEAVGHLHFAGMHYRRDIGRSPV